MCGGLYDLLSSTILGFVFAVLTVLLFIAYVRSVEAMRSAIRAAAGER